MKLRSIPKSICEPAALITRESLAVWVGGTLATVVERGVGSGGLLLGVGGDPKALESLVRGEFPNVPPNGTGENKLEPLGTLPKGVFVLPEAED